MTREEEIYKIAGNISPDWCKGIDCGSCYANTYYGCCQYVELAKCLYDKGYRNQADLLEEFVEWYKSKVIKDRIKISKEQEEYCNEIGDSMKAILWEYENNVLQRMSYCLNDDLKKFLEEKEK